MNRRLLVGVLTVVASTCGLSPAVASAAEQISGTVTATAGGAPIQGVCVAAWDPNDGTPPDAFGLNGVKAFTSTASDGTYTLNLPAAGDYKVSWQTGDNGPCGTNATPVITEYYNEKTSHATADLINVSIGENEVVNEDLAFPAATTGSISGRVTHLAGSGYQSVCVAALDPGSSAIVGNPGTTNANGDYTITSVPAGSYKVIFTTSTGGCTGAEFKAIDEYYNNQANFASGNTVPVTNGTTTSGIDADLNALPRADDDFFSVVRNSGANPLNVVGNDDELDPFDTIEITAVTQPAHGVTVINQGTPDNIDYATSQDYCGPDSFTYTVNGGDTATVSVTVQCDPVAVPDSVTVDRNSGANTIDVLANDTDQDGGEKKVAGKLDGNHGTVDIGPGGANLIYTPASNYCGADQFIYSVNGGSTAQVDVTVNCPNAVNDAATVGEDSGANAVDVRANDTGNPKTVVTKTNGANGSVAIVGGGLTYTPNANFCGQDTFTYGLNGPPNPAAPATVAVTVTCVDDNPIAVGDSKTVDEDAAATPIDVLANDTDVDVGARSVASKTDGGHGAVAITGGGTGLTYTPAANYCGADSFTYTLNGGSRATVTVTVTCVDDAPSAANDAATVGEDSGANAIDVLSNDSDIDSPKTVASKTDPAHGAVAITDAGAKVSYTPAADYCGADSFTYTLTGGGTGSVSVTVSCVDDPPVAVNDAQTVTEDALATAIDIFANDTDVDDGPRLVTATSVPEHGTAAITGDGTGVTYKPAANYCGPDSFIYTLSGGSTGTVAMDVTCVDDEAPDTLITSGPKKKVRTFKRRVRVTFAFKPTEAGSTFRCKLDNGDFKTCKSPKSYRLRPGRHTFQVAAVDQAGNVDPTPAKRKVKVVRRRRG